MFDIYVVIGMTIGTAIVIVFHTLDKRRRNEDLTI